MGKCWFAVLLGAYFGSHSSEASERWHPHVGIDRWRRSRAVRSASRARVVLRTSPAETDAGVANGVALHLVDGHLGSVALDELDETTALARRDLDIGYLSKPSEERAELILGDVTGETTNEDGGVVRIRELVHRLRSAIVAHWGCPHAVHADWASLSTVGHAHTGSSAAALVLGSSSRDTHRTVAAVDTLHFGESALLVLRVGEANESVTARHAADWVRHDLGGLDGAVFALEEGDEDVFIDLWTEIANKDGVLRAAIVSTS